MARSFPQVQPATLTNHRVRRVLSRPFGPRVVLALALVFAVSCESGGSGASGNGIGGAPSPEAPEIELLDSNKISDLPGVQSDASLFDTLPGVVARTQLAGTGMQIAYTRLGQEVAAEPLFIEAAWLEMQACTEQTSTAPLVVVVADKVEALTPEDDVVFDLRGIPIATSTRRDTAVIQVGETDFMSDGDAKGAHLRTIMARHLWISAALPERDFPYTCL